MGKKIFCCDSSHILNTIVSIYVKQNGTINKIKMKGEKNYVVHHLFLLWI